MFKVLSSHNAGYEIAPNNKLIGEVDYQTMRNALINFFRDPTTKSKDTLLFYFSGHGTLDEDGNTYFATSDLDPLEPYDKGVPFDFLKTMLRASKSNKRVAILDCCYSGEAMLAKGGDENETAKLGKIDIERKIPEGEGIYILASSQGAQKSFPMPDKPYSAFTYFLVEGLR